MDGVAQTPVMVPDLVGEGDRFRDCKPGVGARSSAPCTMNDDAEFPRSSTD